MSHVISEKQDSQEDILGETLSAAEAPDGESSWSRVLFSAQAFNDLQRIFAYQMGFFSLLLIVFAYISNSKGKHVAVQILNEGSVGVGITVITTLLSLWMLVRIYYWENKRQGKLKLLYLIAGVFNVLGFGGILTFVVYLIGYVRLSRYLGKNEVKIGLTGVPLEKVQELKRLSGV